MAMEDSMESTTTVSVFINPGTDPRPGTTRNASAALARFVDQLRHTVVAYRDAANDRDGYWAWRLQPVHGDKTVDVMVPGVDPDITERSEPWRSPRLYVDGSSWLWGYALNIVDDLLTESPRDHGQRNELA